jgi:two-component system KDP operon response regulator KdpE
MESSNRLPSARTPVCSWSMTTAPPVVLLVDDERIILRMLEVNFRAAGFEVETATSGADALDTAVSVRPDAVVLDLGLPDLDGWEVVRRLRELDGLAATPVVVLSGADRDASGARDYASSVNAYVTKPVEPADLVETVRRAIAGPDA